LRAEHAEMVQSAEMSWIGLQDRAIALLSFD
jgi:hypothetical protein